MTEAPALGLAMLLTVGDRTDADGRLLLEDSASAGARQRVARHGVAMQAATCPYRDTPSRFGRSMNVSAYEALRTTTTEVLDGFAWLREQILGRDPGQAGTVGLLYQASYLGITLPLVLFYRAQEPVPPQGALPTVVASIFKASRGLFSVAVALLNEDGASAQTIAARDVVRFAERRGHLVRPEPSRVCAAPTRLIERTISVILGAQPGSPVDSRLPALVEVSTLWRLYQLQDDLARALSTYSHVLGQLTRARPRARPEQLYAQMVPGTTGSFGQLTEAVLGHVNSTQRELNRALGREGTGPSIGLAQLLDLL